MVQTDKKVNKTFAYDEYKNFGGWQEALAAAERFCCASS